MGHSSVYCVASQNSVKTSCFDDLVQIYGHAHRPDARNAFPGR